MVVRIKYSGVRKCLRPVEKTTVIVEINGANEHTHSEIARVWIGQDEAPQQEISIAELLSELQGQGWHLTRACVYPQMIGARVQYDFIRPEAGEVAGETTNKPIFQWPVF